MSYGEELRDEMLIAEAGAEAAARSGYWTTKEGEVLKISEMDSEHIANALNMLKHKGSLTPYTEIFIGQFEEELEKRNRIIKVLTELGLVKGSERIMRKVYNDIHGLLQ